MPSLFETIRSTLKASPAYPGGEGSGIVIVAGGKFLASAYIAIRHLRRHGCRLPIQVWHLGPDEIPDFWRELTADLQVTAVDALRAPGASDFRRLGGWECKIHAIVACPFQRVLLLDADNIPLRDPTFLFEHESVRRHGHIFWPDFYYKPGEKYSIRETAWRELGLPPRAGQEIDSGQIAIDRQACWRQLQATRALNALSDQCYGRLTWGDKDTFTLGWLLTGQTSHVVPIRPRFIEQEAASAFWQYWTDGKPLFQHQRKWFDPPERIAPQLLKDELLKEQSLAYLREFWAAAESAGFRMIQPTQPAATNRKVSAVPTPSTPAVSGSQWQRMGTRAFQQGDHERAIACFQQAVALEPANAAFRVDIAAALSKADRPSQALPHLLHALRQQGRLPEIHNNLGAVLEQVGRHSEAASAYHNAVALRPDYLQAKLNLGRALRKAGDSGAAIQAFQEVIEQHTGMVQAYEGIALAAEDVGDVDLMLETLRKLVELQPHSPGTRSWLLYNIHYHPGMLPTQIFQEHLEWDRRFGQNATPRRFARDPDRTRPIRVGYLSPDFRAHTVPRFIGAALRHHDTSRFEVFCYSDVAEPDATTELIRSHVRWWRDVVGFSDEQVARVIEDDRIDILVDLRGHATGNRMALFAQRAGPVQVNMVGYFDTTGLSAMDYRVSDQLQDPPGQSEHFHTETLLRFAPTCWCYTAEQDAPDIRPPPARTRGHFTFGCLNKIIKVTEPCARLWATVLQAVPGSRLLLTVKSALALDAIHANLARLGLPVDHVDLVEKTEDRFGYLERFGEIDIALDTFPFNGITTSCDGLWMGVPLVSLAGTTSVSRAGRSILHGVGLGHLAADTPEQFVQAAARLAGDLDALESLRLGMRERMRNSPLMDHIGFTRGLETELTRIWHRWCDRHGSPEGRDCQPSSGSRGGRGLD